MTSREKRYTLDPGRDLRTPRSEGSYAKAPAGVLKEFTGISDPYEEPKDAEIVIKTAEVTPDKAAKAIMLYMEREGFIGVNNNL